MDDIPFTCNDLQAMRGMREIGDPFDVALAARALVHIQGCSGCQMLLRESEQKLDAEEPLAAFLCSVEAGMYQREVNEAASKLS